jgi:hypothetical protein
MIIENKIKVQNRKLILSVIYKKDGTNICMPQSKVSIIKFP